jgi:hemerythrin superfamily protein
MNNRASPDSLRYTGSPSSRSPEEIESEIENTREKLSGTLDELGHRFSPRERLEAAADSAREYGQRFARAAANTVSPDITTMIRMDHTHVMTLFHRYRDWSSPTKKQALVANACLALEVHAQLEEEIFYPALREAAGHNETLDQSVPEHDEMKRIIQMLRTMDPYDHGYDQKFHDLMRVVVHHVADEESILLPLAESKLRDQLGELGMQMARQRMKLLRPHLGEMTRTTARTFPVLTGVAAVGLLGLGATVFWLVRRNGRNGTGSNLLRALERD